MQSRIIMLCFLFVISSFHMHAQSDLITDRPDQTESALVVPVSYFQFETGYQLNSTSITENSSSFANLFRYGIHERIELRLVSTLESMANAAPASDRRFYVNDMELGTKIQLVNSNVQFAVLSHVSLPIGTDEVSLDAYGFNNRICFSHGLTERIGIGYNVGHYYVQDQFSEFFGTISAGFSLTEKIGCFVEWYGNISEDSDLSVSFDAGFTYLYKANVQFDLAFGYSLNESPDFLGFGVSWRTPN